MPIGHAIVFKKKILGLNDKKILILQSFLVLLAPSIFLESYSKDSLTDVSLSQTET
jgi:hypothetical protein